MKRKSAMKLSIGIFKIVCCSCLVFSIARGQEAKRKLEDTFPIIDLKQNLYTIDDDYVLQAIFSKENELSGVRVVPNYFFKGIHSEWTEPDSPTFMQPTTYQELLRRIERVKSIGSLKQHGRIGIALNLRTSFLDQYDGGVVERVMFRNSPRDPDGVAWFMIRYFHFILGKIDSKKIIRPPVSDWQYRVKVDGIWYWTSKIVFHQSTIGTSVRIMVAGPLESTMQ